MKKYIILGVAYDWGYRKGLDIFLDLYSKISDDYQIVLVGIDASIIDMPQGIICIPRTNSQEELAKIYSAADVFLNPTREDNYPTVNMEAISCGTPVITFNTGGSPEILSGECGLVVEDGDLDGVITGIKRIVGCPENRLACLNACKNFDQNNRFREYISLYK